MNSKSKIFENPNIKSMIKCEISAFSNNLFQTFLSEIFDQLDIELKIGNVLHDTLKVEYENETFILHFFQKDYLVNSYNNNFL